MPLTKFVTHRHVIDDLQAGPLINAQFLSVTHAPMRPPGFAHDVVGYCLVQVPIVVIPILGALDKCAQAHIIISKVARFLAVCVPAVVKKPQINPRLLL